MTAQQNDIERWSRAARPTLFDYLVEPRLVFALILANLMSPSLWAFRDTLRKRIEAGDAGDHGSPERFAMSEIGRYVDSHFYHVPPSEMGGFWGFVPLEDERRRVGREQVDYAVSEILANMHKRQELGSYKPNMEVQSAVDAGLFPEYEYATVDVVRAYRRRLKKKKHRPLGVTCCVDEATLIASLATVLHTASLEELIIIGAPVHFTTLVKHGGETFWFNGKHEFFDQAGWRAVLAGDTVTEDPEQRLQNALDRRVVLERLITPHGWFMSRSDESTLDETAEARILETVAAFFGGLPRLFSESLGRGVHHAPSEDRAMPFASLAQVDSADAAQQLIRRLAREHPGSVFEAALYCHRDLGVAQPEAYLHAARRGPMLRAAAAGVASLEDALAVVAAIENRESIFADRERIALPDEVLLFGTANDRERALLLGALLIDAEGALGVEPGGILFGEASSCVRVGDMCIDAASLSDVELPDTSAVVRMHVDA